MDFGAEAFNRINEVEQSHGPVAHSYTHTCTESYTLSFLYLAHAHTLLSATLRFHLRIPPSLICSPGHWCQGNLRCADCSGIRRRRCIKLLFYLCHSITRPPAVSAWKNWSESVLSASSAVHFGCQTWLCVYVPCLWMWMKSVLWFCFRVIQEFIDAGYVSILYIIFMRMLDFLF